MKTPGGWGGLRGEKGRGGGGYQAGDGGGEVRGKQGDGGRGEEMERERTFTQETGGGATTYLRRRTWFLIPNAWAFFDFCCPEGGGIGSGVEYLEGEVGSGRAGPSGGCQACLRGRCSAVLAPFLFLAVSWDFEALDPPFFRMNVIQCLRSLGTARRGSLCWGWAGGLAGWLGTSVAQRGSENGQGGGCCFAATVFFSWD